MKIIAKIDGNCLCLTREDFIDLQESPAMFIKLTKRQIKIFNLLANCKVCLSCGTTVNEHTNAKGLCDECDK